MRPAPIDVDMDWVLIGVAIVGAVGVVAIVRSPPTDGGGGPRPEENCGHIILLVRLGECCRSRL
jgi:hypothetical protein